MASAGSLVKNAAVLGKSKFMFRQGKPHHVGRVNWNLRESSKSQLMGRSFHEGLYEYLKITCKDLPICM